MKTKQTQHRHSSRHRTLSIKWLILRNLPLQFLAQITICLSDKLYLSFLLSSMSSGDQCSHTMECQFIEKSHFYIFFFFFIFANLQPKVYSYITHVRFICLIFESNFVCPYDAYKYVLYNVQHKNQTGQFRKNPIGSFGINSM